MRSLGLSTTLVAGALFTTGTLGFLNTPLRTRTHVATPIARLPLGARIILTPGKSAYKSFSLLNPKDGNARLPGKPKLAMKDTLKFSRTALLLLGVFSALYPLGAFATEAEHKLHLGHKIANFLRKTGWPDWVILGSISALPIVELRGGIPVGVWLGLSPLTTFGLAVVGNMIPVPLLLLLVGKALKIPFLAKLLSSVQKKADAFKADGQAARALALFVGVPLPGTGAWSGAMIAGILGLDFWESLLSIFLGVVGAGIIMIALTCTGKVGALITGAALLASYFINPPSKPKPSTE